MASIDEMLSAKPLLAFSPYTQIQADALQRMKDEIEAIMGGWDGGPVHDWQRAYDHFWFWVLGAYEVLRTMDQTNGCFAPEVKAKIIAAKRQIAPLRMPFAKQEFRGGGPIHGENSVTGFANKSFQFSIAGVIFDARDVMASVCGLLGSISRSDILTGFPGSTSR